MIDIAQYEINSAYNKFLNQLVLWSYLYKRVEEDREQGFRPVTDYEKMISFQERVQNLLPDMEKLDRSKIRSYSPLLDDMVICAELAGDFHLGYARQLTDKSSLLFDLAF